MQSLLPLVFAFGVMYLLMIRPQQRRMRDHRALVGSLQSGDEVVTGGGLCGTVVSVDDDILTMEVSPGVRVRVLRSAVSQRVGPPEDDAPLGELETDGDAAPATSDDEV